MSPFENFLSDILGRQIYAAISRARLGCAEAFDVQSVISESIDVALGMLEQEDALQPPAPSVPGVDPPLPN